MTDAMFDMWQQAIALAVSEDIVILRRQPDRILKGKTNKRSKTARQT
jgi:hypothetical protein